MGLVRREYVTAYAMVGMEVGEEKVSLSIDGTVHNVTEQGFHYHNTERSLVCLKSNQLYSSLTQTVACPSKPARSRDESFFRQGVKRQSQTARTMAENIQEYVQGIFHTYHAWGL